MTDKLIGWSRAVFQCYNTNHSQCKSQDHVGATCCPVWWMRLTNRRTVFICSALDGLGADAQLVPADEVWTYWGLALVFLFVKLWTVWVVTKRQKKKKKNEKGHTSVCLLNPSECIARSLLFSSPQYQQSQTQQLLREQDWYYIGLKVWCKNIYF